MKGNLILGGVGRHTAWVRWNRRTERQTDGYTDRRTDGQRTVNVILVFSEEKMQQFQQVRVKCLNDGDDGAKR